MGTHSSLPSKLIDGKLLSDHLASDPLKLLGKPISDQYGSRLPFLFKVLAIGKALSIQAHPDRPLAIKLHKERPDVYKDDNHKVSLPQKSIPALLATELGPFFPSRLGGSARNGDCNHPIFRLLWFQTP